MIEGERREREREAEGIKYRSNFVPVIGRGI